MLNKFVVIGLSALTLAPNVMLGQTGSLAFGTQSADAAPQLVALKSAQGTFTSSDKSTQGDFYIKKVDGKHYLKFASNFSTSNGPAVEVLLHREAVPQSYNSNNYVSLGEIKSFQGAQWYAIPENVDINQYQSVSIWCREFDVTFGYGKIQG
ncbi:MAG: DM13 domain-containing protein [Acaryochloridaceae cyanobacterium RL_2_7]|nr:DM13 domain-containing protein [Acaryochloridaceae cyanobacterium RL_2_7]